MEPNLTPDKPKIEPPDLNKEQKSTQTNLTFGDLDDFQNSNKGMTATEYINCVYSPNNIKTQTKNEDKNPTKKK